MHSGAEYPCASSSGPDSSTSLGATSNAHHAPAHDHQHGGLFGDTRQPVPGGYLAAAVPPRYQPQPLFDSPIATSTRHDISSQHPAHPPADYLRSPSITDPAHYRPHTGRSQPFSLHYADASHLPLTLHPSNIHNTSYHSPTIDHVSGYRSAELYRQYRSDYSSPRSIPSIPTTGSLAAIQRNSYLGSPSSLSRSSRMLSSYGESSSSQQSNFPWPEYHNYVQEQLTCDGQVVKPTIHARMEKGFSLINQYWTCYRRNYFEVSCAYHLSPNCQNSRVMLRGKPVQAFGMGIGAVVHDRDLDLREQRHVDILQFTPKRDTNDKRDLTIVRVWPGLPMQSHAALHGQRPLPYYGTSRTPAFVPILPYQGGSSRENSPHGGSPNRYPHDCLPLIEHGNDGLYKQHTFDRLQFKTATANNGKRRASQQYYRLKISLYADTREDGASEPAWHRLCEIVSDSLVVRGRSPNHYKTEDSGQDADEREGGEPGPSGDRTPSFGRHTGYSYAHQVYDSPGEPRSRSNVGGFRGYDSGDNQSPPGGSSEASLTPENNFEAQYDQYGDDIKHEIREGFGDVQGFNEYTYNTGTFLEPVSGPHRTEEQYSDPLNMHAFRQGFPNSHAAPRWERIGLDDNADFRAFSTSTNFPSSIGYYPDNMTEVYSDFGSIQRPDTAFQIAAAQLPDQ